MTKLFAGGVAVSTLLLTVVVAVTSIVPGVPKKYFYLTNRIHFDNLVNEKDVDNAGGPPKAVIFYFQSKTPIFIVETRRRKTQRPRVEYSPGSVKSAVILKTGIDLDDSFKNHLKKLLNIKDEKKENNKDINADIEN